MSEIKIEKGIPIPDKGKRKSAIPFDKMEVGDSFLVRFTQRTGIHTTAKRFGITITSRQEGDKVRIWRTK